MYEVRMYDVRCFLFIEPFEDGVAVEFEEEGAVGFEAQPQSASCEGFGATGRGLDARYASDDASTGT